MNTFLFSKDKGKEMKTGQLSTCGSVAAFYAGRSVFMTGVTGFLGKVYLEKLLYSCKDIDKVYLLIRDKKGANAQQRIKELIDKPIFSRLKEERPQDFKKIIPVRGDLHHPDLGISKQDEETLLEKVSVVFHVAATIKFQEEFKFAMNTNVRGTKYLLNLCQRMKNIKVFVHVSTAFCNTDQKILEEKVYPPPAELSEVAKFLEQSHNEKQIKAFLKGRPNTYTFTKALAETCVLENHGNIPTVIIRPAIVSAAITEPIAGWVDTWAGATGLITAVMKGANRVIIGDPNNVLDLIPVDYVANLTIVAAARCSGSGTVTVYNCSTSSCNPIILHEIFQCVKKTVPKTDNSHITLTFTSSELSLSVLTFLLQTIPAYAIDLLLRAKGKPPKYMKLQSKITAARDLLNFFTSHSWVIKADRARVLHASLSTEDRHQFPCDPSFINWNEYMAVYLAGIKGFMLK